MMDSNMQLTWEQLHIDETSHNDKGINLARGLRLVEE